MIRNTEIYVSSKTKRRLFWIKKLSDEHGPPATIDEIGDNLLNQKIEEKYPAIKTLEKRLDALEDQLIVELLNPK